MKITNNTSAIVVILHQGVQVSLSAQESFASDVDFTSTEMMDLQDKIKENLFTYDKDYQVGGAVEVKEEAKKVETPKAEVKKDEPKKEDTKVNTEETKTAVAVEGEATTKVATDASKDGAETKTAVKEEAKVEETKAAVKK